jgi:cysteinyl-tRNA synthetase
MALVLTNTLSGKKETFTPLVPGKIRLYVCGPTVYNFVHIGNARPCVFWDVVHKFLEYSGFEVTRVMNFTDVDDKIIVKSREEKTSSLEVSERFTKEFLHDMSLLGVSPPQIAPKVTDHIPEIIKMIEGLIKNGVAYVATDGEVFYSVRSFHEYGKLSGKNIDDLKVGVRIQPGELKRDPLDFSLWKPQKAADEPSWESPWGKGRPGWHIECSAMAIKYLGETFDIHGGGMDLIHPHHENEIAQSEGFSKKPFVRYWIHSNMLTFNSAKMSKSVGNIMLIRDFVKKYGAETLRYFLLSGHYRSTIDYSGEHIREIQSALHRFYTTLGKCETLAKAPAKKNLPLSEEEKNLQKTAQEFEAKWRESMEDDLNTARLLGYVFEYVRALNAYIDKKGFQETPQTAGIAQGFLTNIQKLSKILNIFGQKSSDFLEDLKRQFLEENGMKSEEIDRLIAERMAARQAKDFAKSDRIRDELLAKGIELRDRAATTEWDIIIK